MHYSKNESNFGGGNFTTDTCSIAHTSTHDIRIHPDFHDYSGSDSDNQYIQEVGT